jgi:hypothetical protein
LSFFHSRYKPTTSEKSQKEKKQKQVQDDAGSDAVVVSGSAAVRSAQSWNREITVRLFTLVSLTIVKRVGHSDLGHACRYHELTKAVPRRLQKHTVKDEFSHPERAAKRAVSPKKQVLTAIESQYPARRSFIPPPPTLNLSSILSVPDTYILSSRRCVLARLAMFDSDLLCVRTARPNEPIVMGIDAPPLYATDVIAEQVIHPSS